MWRVKVSEESLDKDARIVLQKTKRRKDYERRVRATVIGN